MSDIRKLLNQLENIEAEPKFGDGFFIEFGDLVQIETIIESVANDSITVVGDERVFKFIENLNQLYEAEYQGRKVKLNKPTKGDVKKFKVFVKDPSTGNVKKVNFGDPNMTIKKHNPERRKSFRARHKCDTAKDKTSARYWSCKKW